MAKETKEGKYNKYSIGVNYKKDNLGFNKSWKSTFNTDVLDMNVSGPEPITKYLVKDLLKIKFPGEITLFGNFFMNISDGFQSVAGLYEGNYKGYKAKQLYSSIFDGTRFTPRENNNWYWLGKVTWKLKENMKLDTFGLCTFN